MSNVTRALRTLTRRRRADAGQPMAGRSGAAVLEFALVAPMLLAMVIGVMEFALVIFVSVLLEGSIREASRFGLTLQSVSGTTREAHIAEVINDGTYGLVTIGPDDVEITVYPDFDEIVEAEHFTDLDDSGDYDVGEPFVDANDNGSWDAGNGTPGAGSAGDVVVYRVTADWSTVTPLVGAVLPNNGLFSLSASIAVRNEPP